MQLTLEIDELSTRVRHSSAQASQLETELGQARRELGMLKDGQTQEGL